MDTSYLTQQVTSIISQLHNLFDEIGVPSHERDSRESELFSSLSETLHNHLRLVSAEKNGLVEEGQRIITTIKQMETSLDDARGNSFYAPKNDELKITYPLLECLHILREKHKTISKLHQERFEQVKKLIHALESYSSHLESSFLQIKLPPVAADGTVPPSFDLSPSYINSVDAEFTRVYDEYNKRVASVQQLAEEIIKLWAELGTPQAQTDGAIVKYYRDAPEQLGLHQQDLKSLRDRREKLVEEKRVREKRVKDLRTAVEALWDRLGIDDKDRKSFLASTRGCGLRTINDLEDELSRLNELKRQNLHLFVEDARTRLQALWDELFFSEEEAVEFTPMFCDVYSDALLSAHEAEIQRLETLKEQRAPTLQLIAKHRSLIKDRDELAASSQDASRLLMKPQKGEKRDPTRLLREEKMRKRIAKDLPKVESELTKVLTNWEDEYGRPFLVFGERYVDILEEASAKAPPPRSKTPNGMGPPPKPAKAAPGKTVQSSREPPPPRSKTPASAAPRNHPPSARPAPSTKSPGKSPSRIPARVPLGNMPQGNNSPERTQTKASAKTDGAFDKRPMMAPPPKMRELRPPSPGNAASANYSDEVLRSGSVVRSCLPEDPYHDNRSHMHSSQSQYHRQIRPPSPQRNNYRDMPPPSQPYHFQHPAHHVADTASTYSTTASTVDSVYSSRQASNTSSNATALTTATSNSENWETYEDHEFEPERDATAAYHAKLRAAQERSAVKRGVPDGYADSDHRSKIQRGPLHAAEGHHVAGASEAGWMEALDS